jgi:predicted PurR-regulated permease PerM
MPEPAQHDLMQTMLRVAFFILLAGASLWIFSPFLLATIWASMVVIATWPMMLRLQEWLGGRRSWTVAVLTVALLMLFVVPFTLGAMAIVNQAAKVSEWVKLFSTGDLPPPPAWLQTVPVLGPKATAMWQEVIAGGPSSLAARVAPYLGDVFQWFVGKLGGLGMLLVQFLLTVIISAILYANGEAAASGLLQFGRRLGGAQGENAMVLAAKAVRGIALGVGVTALVQTAASGIGLAVAGVPAAALLTALIFVLCIAQLGPILILLPSVAWVFWSGDNVTGGLLLVWSILVAAMDNFLRPLLIKKGVDLPLLLIMSGVMGGLIAFGIVGIFAGPVILAVTYTLLEDWVGRRAETQP